MRNGLSRRLQSAVLPPAFSAGVFIPEGFDVFISNAFAQAAPAAAGGEPGSYMQFLFLGGMLVVMYLMMIRPQMKRQKEHKAMIDAIAKGDEIVTAGGIIGKITKVGETFIGVEIASGVEVQIQRSAIAQVLPKGSVK